MKIHDITLTISESLVVYPGDPATHITRAYTMGMNSDSNLTRIDMCTHTGTHVDAPMHFLEKGVGAESLNLDVLIGPALVTDTGAADFLTADVLDKLQIPENTERVLFRTKNSKLLQTTLDQFSENFVSITNDGALWLVNKGIKLVGIDYLSIASFKEPGPVHKILLEGGVIPVEGLALDGITPGMYFLACLPMKIQGSDGAPARAVLIEDFMTNPFHQTNHIVQGINKC